MVPIDRKFNHHGGWKIFRKLHTMQLVGLFGIFFPSIDGTRSTRINLNQKLISCLHNTVVVA